jgi:glucose-6-phosphate 1-dehydrogenase
MGEMVSDALVFFDATGDLAYKKFLRALQAMVKRGHLNAIEMDGYEHVVSDAMEGDRAFFAREDYVEEGWRIVELVITPGLCCTSTSLALGGLRK